VKAFYSKLVYLIVAVALVGCAAQPLKVDVQSSIGSQTKLAPIARVSAIQFVNKATDPVLVNQLLDDSYIPIKTDPPTKLTVEDDVRRMLEKVLAIDPNASTVLNIKIQQAEAFWVYGIADRIPFVGIATAGAEREFLMNVKFSIEIENSGKVKSTYFLDERYSMQGSAALPSDVKLSYERLITKYRRELEHSLQSDFVARYL
jgi:hypothetical protein